MQPRTATYFILSALLCGCGFLLTNVYLPQWRVAGGAFTVVITTKTLLIGVEGSSSMRQACPSYFEISARATAGIGVIACFWALVVGVFSSVSSRTWEEQWPIVIMGAVVFPLYCTCVSVPASLLYALIRKQFRSLPADNFVRCRKCDYRVDNLTGPRCPECGTPIAGLIEDANA